MFGSVPLKSSHTEMTFMLIHHHTFMIRLQHLAQSASIELITLVVTPRAFIALRSKSIVLRFKHRISEVFISGDVSLHSIVIFLSYKTFDTCEILLWITKGDTKFCSEISNVYALGMDGIFKSNLTNISIEYSLNTTSKGLLSLKNYSPVIYLCD